MRQNGSPNTVIMLIGNKADMEARRQVSAAEGEKFAADHGLIFLETSAKTAANVEQAFLKMTTDIKTRVAETGGTRRAAPGTNPHGGVRLPPAGAKPNNNNNNGGGCPC